jgi:hypothetical protein
MSEPFETRRPPKAGRNTKFKPGQSGNLLGRPKRKLDMSVALNKALNDTILVTNLGKKKTGLEAVVQSIVDRVLQGESKGIPELMGLLKKAKLLKPVPNPTRLTGVVVMPDDYRKDRELGIEQGYYVFAGISIWVHPDTKEFYYAPSLN